MGLTVLLYLWKTILERFNKNQFKLRRSEVTLTALVKSIRHWRNILRQKEVHLKRSKEASALCGNKSYLVSRNRKKSIPVMDQLLKLQESCLENTRRICYRNYR